MQRSPQCHVPTFRVTPHRYTSRIHSLQLWENPTGMRKAAIALALGFLAYKGLRSYVATIEHFAFRHKRG